MARKKLGPTCMRRDPDRNSSCSRNKAYQATHRDPDFPLLCIRHVYNNSASFVRPAIFRIPPMPIE